MLAHSVVASDIIICEPPIFTEIRYCRDVIIHVKKGMTTSSLEGRYDERFWFLHRQLAPKGLKRTHIDVVNMFMFVCDDRYSTFTCLEDLSISFVKRPTRGGYLPFWRDPHIWS
jgi:hypothetical protein